VFPADAANFIFCPAQQVTSLIFVHESIMARSARRITRGCLIVACAIDCLGGRKRRGRKLLNRRSARTAACPSVTVRYPGLLSDRARSGHGIAPLLDDCCTLQGMARVPIRAGYGLALGFWPEGVQRLRGQGWPQAVSEGNAKRP